MYQVYRPNNIYTLLMKRPDGGEGGVPSYWGYGALEVGHGCKGLPFPELQMMLK